MTQPPPPQDLGAIELHLQGSMMTSNLVPPSVTVNGYPVPTKYGINVIPMPPGRHRVDVWSQWLKKFGQADLEVDVQAHQPTRVFYAVPYHQFSRGSIGLEKQKRKGAAVMIGIVAVAALVGVLLVAL